MCVMAAYVRVARLRVQLHGRCGAVMGGQGKTPGYWDDARAGLAACEHEEAPRLKTHVVLELARLVVRILVRGEPSLRWIQSTLSAVQ